MRKWCHNTSQKACSPSKELVKPRTSYLSILDASRHLQSTPLWVQGTPRFPVNAQCKSSLNLPEEKKSKLASVMKILVLPKKLVLGLKILVQWTETHAN